MKHLALAAALLAAPAFAAAQTGTSDKPFSGQNYSTGQPADKSGRSAAEPPAASSAPHPDVQGAEPEKPGSGDADGGTAGQK